MEHGGDLILYKSLFNGECIDFSANINPDGAPPHIFDIFATEKNCLHHYPDIQYRNLKKNIAAYLSCDVSHVLVGNGAMELIDGFIQKFKTILIAPPCFEEYAERAKVHNKKRLFIPYQYDNIFFLDEKNIATNLDKNTLVVLANPNNPTAHTISKNNLLRLYHTIVKHGAFLLLDETFFEYAELDYDTITLFKNKQYQNIAIIRAATKFFGMPGLRLGYACTNEKIAGIMQKRQISWSVNCFAEIAGSYIFTCKEYITHTKDINKKRRFLFITELQKIPFIEVFPSNSNFILIKLLRGESESLFLFCAKLGIFIRRANSFFTHSKPNLKKCEWIRVAVKTEVENQKLVEALKSFFYQYTTS